MANWPQFDHPSDIIARLDAARRRPRPGPVKVPKAKLCPTIREIRGKPTRCCMEIGHDEPCF